MGLHRTLGVVLLAATVASADESLIIRVAPETIKDVTPTDLHDLPEPAKHGEGSEEKPARSEEECGWYTHAEYLLLRARRQGMDYALSDDINDGIPRGKTNSLNYQTRSAFRAGLGYRAEEGWDFGVNYTYLRTGNDRAINAPPNGILYPSTLTRPGLIDEVQSANAKANLEYDLYDVEIGNTAELGHGLDLRTFGGLRFARIRQSLDANYNGLLAADARVRSRSDFSGTGPMLGLEANRHFYRGFSLYARGSGGLIVGHGRTELNETNDSNNTLNADIGAGFSKVVPVMTLGLGVAWEHRGLRLQAGYEVTNWFNLIERPAFIDDFSESKTLQRTSDLSVDGFFVRMMLSF